MECGIRAALARYIKVRGRERGKTIILFAPRARVCDTNLEYRQSQRASARITQQVTPAAGHPTSLTQPRLQWMANLAERAVRQSCTACTDVRQLLFYSRHAEPELATHAGTNNGRARAQSLPARRCREVSPATCDAMDSAKTLTCRRINICGCVAIDGTSAASKSLGIFGCHAELSRRLTLVRLDDDICRCQCVVGVMRPANKIPVMFSRALAIVRTADM